MAAFQGIITHILPKKKCIPRIPFFNPDTQCELKWYVMMLGDAIHTACPAQKKAS